MPFITIEIDDALQFSLQPFARQVHEYISSSLDIPIDKLKTKVERIKEAYVGEGDALYARLKIELKAGRDMLLLQSVVSELLEKFSLAIKSQNPKVACRITVEFREIHPDLIVAQAVAS